MAIRISSGITVQSTSIRVFSWKFAGFWPVERRWMIIDQIITAKTNTPMTTQIQKMVMCRLNTERLTSVTPRDMLTSHAACAWLNSEHSSRPIPSRGCRNIAGSPIVLVIPPKHRAARKRQSRLHASTAETGTQGAVGSYQVTSFESKYRQRPSPGNYAGEMAGNAVGAPKDRAPNAAENPQKRIRPRRAPRKRQLRK